MPNIIEYSARCAECGTEFVASTEGTENTGDTTFTWKT